MTFGVPKFDLKIPESPITYQPTLDAIEEALRTYKDISLKDIDFTQFGTFKLRLERAKFLRALLQITKPEYTLEFGSGGSTIYFAMAVQRHHVAFEHLDWCFERTTDALADYGLEDKATVELLDLNDETGMYEFDPNMIPGPVDLLLIDGPPVSPKRKGRPRHERWNTLPFMLSHLSDRAIVILDSTERSYEQEYLQFWVEEYGIAFLNPGDPDSRLKGFGVIDPWHSVR